MKKRMLIDASHPEETRVVVLDGSKVEEFDFEAASRRPLKGNIYLAKVTRVEPSLQAAFVEYGGNRQGFLAFSEIHPDYYQIPFADRQALIAEQEEEARRRQEDDIESFDISARVEPEGEEEPSEEEEGETGADDVEVPLVPLDAATVGAPDNTMESTEENDADAPQAEPESDSEAHDEIFVNHAGADEDVHDHEDVPHAEAEHDAGDESDSGAEAEAGQEDAGGDALSSDAPAEPGQNLSDAQAMNEGAPGAAEDEEDPSGKALHAQRPPQKWMRRKHYKIQEVIKRRQIILVQVVKEERGNKGAALTTYLSLAGRYCVLMPNTPRGGGISRKITNAADRKRLKSAAQGLELPEGMGLIIRTAGENRGKVEIKRDFEYLTRLWDTIREKTLSSNAPAAVYEEGNLIKRAIRDLYNKDVADVVVEGEEGFRNARDFMRMLMPTHARHVHQYRDSVPLFQRMHIEQQLDAMFSPTVTLKSGGYIVINQTEALVSIDVNSGRATREHSIEETARKTNLEAADEVGRQLRLRDLAGLIVIDFIDMEEGRNDREVEKRLREAVKNDRARVQIGKISQFGLLEMSRQRLRAGVVAGSTVACPHCGGAGIVRSVESTALRVLRALEEEGEKGRAAAVAVRVAGDVAIYALNQKRRELARIEAEYDMEVSFEPKEGLLAGTYELERTRQKEPGEKPRSGAVPIEAGFVPSEEADDAPLPVEEDEEEAESVRADDGEAGEEPADIQAQAQGEERGGRRRRRRGGRGRSRAHAEEQGGEEGRQASQSETPAATSEQHVPEDEPADDSQPIPLDEGEHPRRRRRRRRGRRGGREHPPGETPAPASLSPDANRFGASADEIDTTPRDDVPALGAPAAPVWSLKEELPDTTPRDTMTKQEPASEEKPAKKGWWQRTFSGGE